MQWPISSCHACPGGQPPGVGVGAGGADSAQAMQCPIWGCQKSPAGQTGVAPAPDTGLDVGVLTMQCPIWGCQKVPAGHVGGSPFTSAAATSGLLSGDEPETW